MKDHIIKDPAPFEAINGKYYETMKEVETINDAFWQSMLIIDKDNELFRAPLSPEIYGRIVASPNYRCLIDILEERIKEQQLGDSESKGMKR